METQVKFSKKDKVAILTGAGISAESGLKTFRDNNGLWENHPVEEVATPQGFNRNPRLVWKFYKQRASQLKKVEPNPGHYALKKLEDYLENNFNLITQNIDELHSRAGNKRILHMHGTLQFCICTKCGKRYKMGNIDLDEEIPKCKTCRAKLRPDIVWFGELPKYLDEIQSIMKSINYFIVIGTSGVVYPAAQLLQIAKQNRVYTIGVNLEVPLNMKYIDEFHQGKSGEILPKLVEQWINIVKENS